MPISIPIADFGRLLCMWPKWAIYPADLLSIQATNGHKNKRQIVILKILYW